MSCAAEVAIFSDVSKTFQKEGKSFYACKELSFALGTGEIVAIVGETGCGKSTALSMLLGLHAPSQGTVRVLGIDPFVEFDKLKGRIGTIFQSDRLLPWRTALQNVTFGLEILRIPEAERNKRACTWLERVGLADFINSYPHQLSGGMRQRVSIARAFVIDPPLIVADEAFTALDELTAASLRRDLRKLIEETKTSTLFVTHSVAEAAELAERVLVFGRPGRIVHEVSIPKILAMGRGRAGVEEAIRYGLQLARNSNLNIGDHRRQLSDASSADVTAIRS